jgi:hypothetical protein
MPVASAISLCPDICGLRNIGVQRKLPCLRTSDDEHSVCRSTGVLSTTGVDGYAACRMAWTPPVSREDIAHLMLRRHITCQFDRRRSSPVINARGPEALRLAPPVGLRHRQLVTWQHRVSA